MYYIHDTYIVYATFTCKECVIFVGIENFVGELVGKWLSFPLSSLDISKLQSCTDNPHIE